MRDFIAEQLLKLSFYVASPFTERGEPVRWTVRQYFRRFRWKPQASVRTTVVEEYRGAVAEQD